MTPRAITGLGICSAIGFGREDFFRALDLPQALRKSPFPNTIDVPDFDAARWLGDKGLRTLDRLTKLLVVSTRLALHDSRLKENGSFAGITGDRVGIVSSNAYGSLEAITELNRVAVLEDARYINPAKFPNTVANSASGYASIWEDIRALNVAISDGNCGALDAITCADIFLAADRADAILVGGAESLSEALVLAFERLGMLSPESKLGEGAALVVVETIEHARKRNATVLAEIVGSGSAFDAPDTEATRVIHASSETMSRAIDDALRDADLDRSKIDRVVSGVSGLRFFDEREIEGITQCVGAHVPIDTPKRLLGETLGASGAMGVAAALARIHRGVKTVLVTSTGYYGHCSAIVLREPRS